MLLRYSQAASLAEAAQALELGQVVAAAANIYQRCLQRSRVAHARDETNPVAQLELVANDLGDLRAALAAQQQQPPPGLEPAEVAAVAVAGVAAAEWRRQEWPVGHDCVNFYKDL